ncbi:hypothetical protein M3B04_11110 [Corynebacterium sanguinis]|uniref:hypothetical protein n=1 Tax=Corynebacterium sanguinis TaxID=2594913 RepID=UPI00223AA2CB|nr:hypothetical protein [Corynebacterium sanguinis]MCT1629469.1 hypothetical protein [Corynebacterium sanguinis]
MTNTTPDPSRNLDDNPQTHSPDPMPRWVKTAGIIALVVVVLVVLVLVFGDGNHGPSRHGLGMPAEGAFLVQEHL